ncbi:hypothetical protein F4779DRAFT_124651 [Xylariaceae sp. FL0662B]|nr:hypothetical protein F4779DRAFT_124651 [Xylariaceae sp. FL0662B]
MYVACRDILSCTPLSIDNDLDSRGSPCLNFSSPYSAGFRRRWDPTGRYFKSSERIEKEEEEEEEEEKKRKAIPKPWGKVFPRPTIEDGLARPDFIFRSHTKIHTHIHIYRSLVRQTRSRSSPLNRPCAEVVSTYVHKSWGSRIDDSWRMRAHYALGKGKTRPTVEKNAFCIWTYAGQPSSSGTTAEDRRLSWAWRLQAAPGADTSSSGYLGTGCASGCLVCLSVCLSVCVYIHRLGEGEDLHTYIWFGRIDSLGTFLA